MLDVSDCIADCIWPGADNLSKAGWSWGCVSTVDSREQIIFIADAHRDDGKPFIVRADEKLTAFVELETAMQRVESHRHTVVCIEMAEHTSNPLYIAC